MQDKRQINNNNYLFSLDKWTIDNIKRLAKKDDKAKSAVVRSAIKCYVDSLNHPDYNRPL